MIDYDKLLKDLFKLYDEAWALDSLELHKEDDELSDKLNDICIAIQNAEEYILTNARWYATLTDETDTDLGTGSYDHDEAVCLAGRYGCKLIAHCINGEVVDVEEVKA